MRANFLWLALLLAVVFTLATAVGPGFEQARAARPQGGDGLSALLGGSRRLFAEHFFVKADQYFHSGYYPTIFDDQTSFHTPHMALYANVIDQDKRAQQAPKKGWFQNVVDVSDEGGSPGFSRDWIDEFGRGFYPVRHTHLDQRGEKGEMRELLPWLKIAAELNPERVETFVVTAFWLRTEVGKTDEAEEFLRDGLRANPNNCEILFELGRIYLEHRRQPERARHVWELAVAQWHEVEAPKTDPNIFIFAQITGQLAKMEEEQGRYTVALQHLQALKAVSPSPDSIQKLVADVWTKLGTNETTHPLEML